MTFKKCILLFLTLSTLIPSAVSCQKTEKEPMVENYYDFFDTVSTIYSYREESPEEFSANTAEVEEILKKYHRLCDIYYEYSGINNLKTINDKAGKSAVTVDPALIEFLLYAKDICIKTENEANILMGAVLSIWHDSREAANTDPDTATLPDKNKLEEASKHISPNALVIDKEKSTVFITDPDARLDVGAIAKGYATEMAAKALISRGISSYVLNVGGNLRIIGSKPNGDGWVTGITNPDKSSMEAYALRLKLKDTSCVTSGNYERYFTVNGKNYHHIIDKDTLYPAEYFTSVTVITENSALADCLSTALFCISYEEGLALVEDIGDIEVIWIYDNGEIKTTNGVKKLIYG